MLSHLPAMPCRMPDGTSLLFELTESDDYSVMTGRNESGIYCIRVSKVKNDCWHLCVGDFIGYCEENRIHGLLLLSDEEYKESLRVYQGHRYNEPLRKGEPSVLIHSTTPDGWRGIQRAGHLFSWNRLHSAGILSETRPIGMHLGDPEEFSDYIMFGSGVTGEIVVCSKESGFINMDAYTTYHPGARLYFDAQKMGQDGLLIRDGAHIKVRDELPLEPYLLFAATCGRLELSPSCSPYAFCQAADQYFERLFGSIATQ